MRKARTGAEGGTSLSGVTHAPGDAFDDHTSSPWPDLCREVAKLRVRVRKVTANLLPLRFSAMRSAPWSPVAGVPRTGLNPIALSTLATYVSNSTPSIVERFWPPRGRSAFAACPRLNSASRYSARMRHRVFPGPSNIIDRTTWLIFGSKSGSKAFRSTPSRAPISITHRSTSAATPAGEVLIDARDIRDQLGHGLELILDGGFQPNEPSTVIDLTGEAPRVVRQGKGDGSDL